MGFGCCASPFEMRQTICIAHSMSAISRRFLMGLLQYKGRRDDTKRARSCRRRVRSDWFVGEVGLRQIDPVLRRTPYRPGRSIAGYSELVSRLMAGVSIP